MKVLALLVALVCVYGGFAQNDTTYKSVSIVSQSYTQDVNRLLSNQIKHELLASYFYQAYASFFQRADVNLPGCHKFFIKSSEEEKKHAQSLIEMVNKRGGHVMLHSLNLKNFCSDLKKLSSTNTASMCICNQILNKDVDTTCGTFSTEKAALRAFKDALSAERNINKELLDLHKKLVEKETKYVDAQLAHFIEHEYLEEQVQSIFELGNIVTRLESFGNSSYALGEYMFDQALLNKLD